MKNKTKKYSKNKKTPISIILIIVWMFLMVFRGFGKLINIRKFELNQMLFGKTFALINYFMDIMILIVFIILITLFMKRSRNAWKYFIYLMLFLILGVIIGSIYGLIYSEKFVDVVISQRGINFPPQFFIFAMIIGLIIVILFYSLLIYLVYKNRNYFKR